VAVGTPVTIVTEKLPRLRNTDRLQPGILAADSYKGTGPIGPVATR
jgi:hypothetical protein